MSSPFDPYQPPASPLVSPADLRDHPTPFGPEEIETARRRLAEHCRNRAALERDRATEGGLLSTTTLVAGGFLLAFIVTAVLGKLSPDEPGVLLFVGAFGAFIAFLVLTFGVVTDLMVGSRSQATDPKSALVRWFRAARAGKAGYAVAALAPTARERLVAPPRYTEQDRDELRLDVSSRSGMKTYLKGFSRPGDGFVRWFQAKKVRVIRQDGDLAVVSAELKLTRWPQWANVLSVLTFVLVRLLGLILALVLYYTLKKTLTLSVEKTLLRGPNGLWYVLDADLRR